MTERLRLLLVDQNAERLTVLRRSLGAIDHLELVGESGFGAVALTWAKELRPDVVLVAVQQPWAIPLATIETLASGTPPWTVVALAARFEQELFRKAVLAGARDVALQSSSSQELYDALVEARRSDLARRSGASDPSAPPGLVITVFGVKGGVGKTTIATNLAVSLARETSRAVALVDLELQFGDVAMMLDIIPERHVLGALRAETLNQPERLQQQLIDGPAGVRVLPAPHSPEELHGVSGEEVGQLLTRLAALHDFVVVDTAPGLGEVTAAALDASALALLVVTPEVTCLRRSQACLSLLESWQYPMDKVKVILNRAGSRTRLSEAEVGPALGRPIDWRVANHHAAMASAALGQPAVLAHPGSPMAADIRAIARQIGNLPAEPERRPGFLGWLEKSLLVARQL